MGKGGENSFTEIVFSGRIHPEPLLHNITPNKVPLKMTLQCQITKLTGVNLHK